MVCGTLNFFCIEIGLFSVLLTILACFSVLYRITGPLISALQIGCRGVGCDLWLAGGIIEPALQKLRQELVDDFAALIGCSLFRSVERNMVVAVIPLASSATASSRRRATTR